MTTDSEPPNYFGSIFKNKGFARIGDILAPRGPIPVSRSNWWVGVKTGRYPSPVKLGPRTTAWRVEDIEELIERIAASATQQ